MSYANVNRLNGFVPMMPEGRVAALVRPRPVAAIRQASGGGNASTDMAVGDAYALDANGTAFRAGPNDVVRGIVWGFRIQPNPNVAVGPLSSDYVSGAFTYVILGIEDAGCEFSVQADTFAQANGGGKFNLTDAAPDSKYRISQQKLNVAGGAGTQFQAIDIVQSPADNAYGTNARVRVKLLTMISD